jgi:Phosphomannose isomerase type I
MQENMFICSLALRVYLREVARSIDGAGGCRRLGLYHGGGRMAGTIFALQAYTQSYDWGKLGSASKAAAYARVATPGFEIDEAKPYAEVE